MSTQTYCITDKARIYPSKTDIEIFERYFGCARFVYNETISRFKEHKIPYNYGLNFFGLDMFTNQILQKEYSFLHEDCTYATRQQASKDAAVAIDNFLKRRGQGRRCSLKFRRKYNPRQSAGVGIKRITNDHRYIQLTRSQSWIRVKGMRDIDGKLVAAKLIREHSHYYICLTYKCHKNISISKNIYINNPENYRSIGIDLGLKSFLVSSEGDMIEAARFYRDLERKLSKEQHKLSKKRGYRKGESKSKNFLRQQHKVQKIYDKISNQRKDFQHKLSTQLVDNYDIIIIENLSVSNMTRNRKLSKSIYDSSWSLFINMLDYKCDRQNKILHKIDRFYPSSQLCSSCGYQNKATRDLSIREWDCPNCNTHHDRDINAAINILNRGLEEMRQGLPSELAGKGVRQDTMEDIRVSHNISQSSLNQETH